MDVVKFQRRFLTEAEQAKVVTLFIALYNSFFSIKKFLNIFS